MNLWIATKGSDSEGVDDVFDLRAGREIKDGDDIKAWLETSVPRIAQIPLSGADNLPLFSWPNRFLGRAVSERSPRLYFDKDEKFGLLGNDIDLSDRGAKIAGDNPVPLFSEIKGCGIFTAASKRESGLGHGSGTYSRTPRKVLRCRGEGPKRAMADRCIAVP